MKLRMVLLLFLLVVWIDFLRCQQIDVNDDKSFYLPNSDRVLENGRIISKTVERPMPVDQQPLPLMQSDDTNPQKLKFIAHGDILVPIDENKSKRTKRKIISERNRFGTSNRWPGGIIPYEFAPGTDYRVQQNVLTAIQHWHDWTCVRFEPYNYQRHRNFDCRITIEDTGSGCATFIGYQPGYPGSISSYSVYLPLVCPLGSAIHELGHVIGFYHEMSRIDRDREIILSFNRMSMVEAAQYEIMRDPQPGYYGQPYDLGSIMHYTQTSAMTSRDEQRAFLMGQRVSLSFLDTKLANLAYQCSDRCSSKPVCENEGYVSQNCVCTCPDGFYGDRCQYLRGYSGISSRLNPPQQTTSTSTRKTTTKTTTEKPKSTENVLRWLEWTQWSNCSESCGSGIRVRTRLCSNTTINGIEDPCASLGGSSFEIESCQNSQCKQSDVILSCTFDLNDESCPIDQTNIWSTGTSVDESSNRPISDHTRGDGKYLLVNRTEFVVSTISKEKTYCLKFWYSADGSSRKTLKIENVEKQIDNNQRGEFWKLYQENLSNLVDPTLIFSDESSDNDIHHFVIDDLSITTGDCLSKSSSNRSERKRRQSGQSCSQVFDLSLSNSIQSITSPYYPNLYSNNLQCYFYIRAPLGYRINFQFSDFNVPSYSRNNCEDSIEVRYYHLGQPGPRYCGTGANTNNLRFTSEKNQLLIVLRSNENYSGRGFNGQASLVR